MIPLSSRDCLPVWDQVTRGLVALLEKGTFSPGERLPEPEKLACQMVLNPASVRRAYAQLVGMGLVEREGEGDYKVAERRKGP